MCDATPISSSQAPQNERITAGETGSGCIFVTRSGSVPHWIVYRGREISAAQARTEEKYGSGREALKYLPWKAWLRGMEARLRGNPEVRFQVEIFISARTREEKRQRRGAGVQVSGCGSGLGEDGSQESLVCCRA